MSNFNKILLVLISLVLILGAAFFLVGYFKPKKAGLYVQASSSAAVYINGAQVGKTPYEATLEPGEIMVRLVPDLNSANLLTYEGKIYLNSGVKTVINREFAETEDKASGSIISLEKNNQGTAEIAVISDPDEASVAIDGQIRGFSPYKTGLVTPGEHQLIISKTGYKEKNLSIKTVKEYKLTVFVKLSKDNTQEIFQTEPPKEIRQTRVEILSTPTGYLKVRSLPGTQGQELTKVKPGETYLFVGEDEKSGWFQITYLEGKNGWVSNQYAQKIEVATTSAETTIKE